MWVSMTVCLSLSWWWLGRCDLFAVSYSPLWDCNSCWHSDTHGRLNTPLLKALYRVETDAAAFRFVFCFVFSVCILNVQFQLLFPSFSFFFLLNCPMWHWSDMQNWKCSETHRDALPDTSEQKQHVRPTGICSIGLHLVHTRCAWNNVFS